MRRSGFTLVEMLAALAVFMIGFVAVYGVFLTAVRYRRIAEDTMRTSVAASSLIAEWRLRRSAGQNLPGPQAAFQHLSDQPGLYWRIVDSGGGAMRILQLVHIGAAISDVSEDDVVRRLNRNGTFDELIARRVVMEYPFVIR